MFYYYCIVCGLSVIFWMYLIYAIYEVVQHRAPWVPAVGRHREIVCCKISELLDQKETPQVVVDAGCGNGRVLVALAKKYPQHKFIGIEYNKILFKYCEHHYKDIKNLVFFNRDLLDYDYSTVDIVYYFGIPALTEKLQNVLLKTPSAVDLISIEQKFPKLSLVEKSCFRFLFTYSFVYHYKN